MSGRAQGVEAWIDLIDSRLEDDDTLSEGELLGFRNDVSAELRALRAALMEIADEESGWPFKVDPLEHAIAVVEAMRDTARRVLSQQPEATP